MCGHVGVCVSMRCPQRPEVPRPGAGVTDAGELPDVGAGNPAQALWKGSQCY